MKKTPCQHKISSFLFIFSLTKRVVYGIIILLRGRGGIGRRARFRILCLFVQVQVLSPAPADSVGTQVSSGDIKNPNLITRRWGSVFSLFAAPADSVGTQVSGGDIKNPNLITQRRGSDPSLFMIHCAGKRLYSMQSKALNTAVF